MDDLEQRIRTLEDEVALVQKTLTTQQQPSTLLSGKDEKEGKRVMNDEMLQEWSRHYDLLQWTAISIFTSIVFLLLADALSSSLLSTKQASNNPSPWMLGAGIWFTNWTIFVVSSFRQFRNNLHRKIQDDASRKFIMESKSQIKSKTKSQLESIFFHQWTGFSLTFTLLNCAWL